MVEERDRQLDTDEVIPDRERDEPVDGERRSSLDRGRYLSTKEAAELLGVNRATVINWARQGKFGGVQYGVRGIYRFDRQELLDFIGRSRIPYPQALDAMADKDAGISG
jgi:excisionase family DNA binding protein